MEKAEERTGEDRQERTARELFELLNELRVILPGVQVLIAFLLMVPFTQRFPDLDDLETGVFYMTLLCPAVATALLIAPSAHHRMLWRRPQGAAASAGKQAHYRRLDLPPARDSRGGLRDHRLHLRPDGRCIVTALLALFFALPWFALPLRTTRAKAESLLRETEPGVGYGPFRGR